MRFPEEGEYRGTLRALPPGTSKDAVHVARVKIGGEDLTAFVKFFPPGSGGLICEAFVWAAAQAIGIPASARAAFVTVDPARLGPVLPKWAAGQDASQLTGWACEQIATRDRVPGILHYAGPGDDDLWEEICASRPGAGMAALDDWVSNNDRSKANLIRLPAGGWAAIDHAEALGSSLWPMTGPIAHGSTQLLSHAERLLGSRDLARFKSLAALSGDGHEPALNSMAATLKSLIRRWHGDAKAEAVLAFLTERAAPAWLKQRLGLIS